MYDSIRKKLKKAVSKRCILSQRVFKQELRYHTLTLPKKEVHHVD